MEMSYYCLVIQIKNSVVILERNLSMTDSIKVNDVRYVKLGKKEDNWEEICFNEGWIPLGYPEMGKKIGREYEETKLGDLEKEYNKLNFAKKKVTSYLNQIKQFYTLGEDTVWVIFKGAKLYWATASMEVDEFSEKDLENYEKDTGKYKEAEKPKTPFLYRKIKPNTEGKTWSCSPIDLTNKDTFDIEKIDGRISKTANGRNSICTFNNQKAPEKVNGYISYLINGGYLKKENQPSYTWGNRLKLVQSLSPTNFEWFVSNIYCQLGYLNLGKVGESTQKDTDLILLSPDKKRVLVQIKTSANQADFKEFAGLFKDNLKDNEEAHFIYHTPKKGKIKEYADYEKLKLKHLDELLNEVKKENQDILLKWLELKCYFGTVESAEA